MVAPRNPLNIGAAARAMSNFGFTSLRLVNPYDVAFREARSAVGAGAVLRGAADYPTLAEAVAGCSLVVGTASPAKRARRHRLHRIEAGAQLIRSHAGPVALLFGSEKFGLSNDTLSHCHWLMHIPTRAEHESMNLGQAVAVCLYEIARGGCTARQPGRAKTAASPGTKPASADRVERITAMLQEILAGSGYTNPKTAASTSLKIRRLIRRLDPQAKDAEMLLGMLRQIRWKLGPGG